MHSGYGIPGRVQYSVLFGSAIRVRRPYNQAVVDEFIEQRDGGYYIAESRVSLDSVIYEFLQGESPEGILQAYPSLSLLQVYAGITYYLAHRTEFDEHLATGEAKFEELARISRQTNPLFYAKLEEARHSTRHP